MDVSKGRVPSDYYEFLHSSQAVPRTYDDEPLNTYGLRSEKALQRGVILLRLKQTLVKLACVLDCVVRVISISNLSMYGISFNYLTPHELIQSKDVQRIDPTVAIPGLVSVRVALP